MSNSPSTKRTIKPSPIPVAGSAQPLDGTFTSDNLSNLSPSNPRKRRASGQPIAPALDSSQTPIAPAPAIAAVSSSSGPQYGDKPSSSSKATPATTMPASSSSAAAPPAKKGRTNTPWTPGEEQRLKQMRDAGKSWAEIAKTFPNRTEGSVKKHWYKDMHYAEFAEDESAALLAAIKEYEANKWKVIGQKVGKPAKACEQYAKENFGGK